ncbi:MAG: FAD-binding oxidoreductase [Pseudomonadota bacterium]
MSEAVAISLWDRSATESPYQAGLDGDSACELAIVGGGFTGLSTALHAAERGLDCHVLEAQQIGYGGSGRNVGFVNAGLWLPPKEVQTRLGKAEGASLIDQLSEMPEYVFSLIQKHQIRCEPHRNGTIHAAHSPAGFADLKSRAEQWKALGAPVELLSKDAASELIGTSSFHGGLLDHRAGTINPMGYVRGLARAAIGAGAKVSTGVTVLKLRQDGDLWKVETDCGTITAKCVVIGTNAYSDDLWPGLKQTFTVINYFQLATEPLGPEADTILPGKQGLWDTGKIMFSLRRDNFDRLILGSMGSVIGGRTGLSQRWAQRMIRRLFPALGAVAIEESWHGKIAMTPDHLFHIHRLADGLYAPIGYNGRGITTGTMFGRALANLLSGADEKTLPVPVTDLKPVQARGLKAQFYETVFTANQIFKSI